jgi:hypothetical protein
MSDVLAGLSRNVPLAYIAQEDPIFSGDFICSFFIFSSPPFHRAIAQEGRSNVITLAVSVVVLLR